MEKVLIGLGGNVGNVAETFDTAYQMIEKMIGKIIKSSSRYRTEPWGNKDQDFFLNQAICVETNLRPQALLNNILDIEEKLGRHRSKNNQFAPRTIDIDILFYGDHVINEGDLLIPHPRLHLRNFVLTPLIEITPDFIHPTFNKKVKDLSEKNVDTSVVIKT